MKIYCVNIMERHSTSFKNHLPIKISIYIWKPEDNIDFFIGDIKPFGIYDTDILLEKGDVLKIVDPNNHNYRLCFPFELHPHLNHIDIGVIKYFNKSSGSGTVYSNADISSLHFKNNFAYPVKIIYRGNVLAVLGYRKEIILNNNGYGFQLLDEILFTFENGIPVGMAKLSDNFMTNIVIGCVSQKIGNDLILAMSKNSLEKGMTLRGVGVNKYHPNDIYSYRIGQPQINGITHYITDARYNTIKVPGM